MVAVEILIACIALFFLVELLIKRHERKGDSQRRLRDEAYLRELDDIEARLKSMTHTNFPNGKGA